jgi:hypothetical protein
MNATDPFPPTGAHLNPATVEGIPAVEALTADGINVNITLMFSLEHRRHDWQGGRFLFR